MLWRALWGHAMKYRSFLHWLWTIEYDFFMSSLFVVFMKLHSFGRWRLYSKWALWTNLTLVPFAVRLLQNSIPDVTKLVLPLLLLYVRVGSLLDLEYLLDPTVVLLTFSADESDFGIVPIHEVVISFAVIWFCRLQLFLVLVVWWLRCMLWLCPKDTGVTIKTHYIVRSITSMTICVFFVMIPFLFWMKMFCFVLGKSFFFSR